MHVQSAAPIGAHKQHSYTAMIRLVPMESPNYGGMVEAALSSGNEFQGLILHCWVVRRLRTEHWSATVLYWNLLLANYCPHPHPIAGAAVPLTELTFPCACRVHQGPAFTSSTAMAIISPLPSHSIMATW